MPLPQPNPHYTPLLHTRGLPTRWLTFSLALHGGLLALFIVHRVPVLKVTEHSGNPTGHNILVSFNPGQSSAASPDHPSKPASSRIKSPIPTVKAPPSLTPPSIDPNATKLSATPGTDTFGAGDIQIASVLVHPPPHPDLNALPSGTRGDVIVDIVIDSTGHISSYTLSRGLGHGVDDTVLATIRQWTFQPATRNGIPVASEQELLFHYERG